MTAAPPDSAASGMPPDIALSMAPSTRSGEARLVPRHAYRVAGRRVVADRPLAIWPAVPHGPVPAAAEVPTVAAVSASVTAPDPAARGASPRLVFDGPGWLGGVRRRVTSHYDECGYVLDVEGVGRFLVGGDGLSAACLSAEPSATPDQVEEAATGIALVLALALQGVFCFHAGAVLAGDRVFAVLGVSGSGKSTLTRWLSDVGNTGWPLVADDVLAVELIDGVVTVRPDHPQPRLAFADQPGIALDPLLPLGGICVLATYDPDGAEEPASSAVAADGLSPSAAVHALASNTLALRLFDQPLASRHVAFCAEVVRQVRVASLRYPRVREALPQVATLLATSMRDGT